MQKIGYIKCCNVLFTAKEYYLNPKNFLKRSLFFADECPKCGQAIAEIREKDLKGFTKVSLRRRGQAAINLREKYLGEIKHEMNMQKGSKTDEYTYYLDKGNIYNLNSRFISTHADFIRNS